MMMTWGSISPGKWLFAGRLASQTAKSCRFGNHCLQENIDHRATIASGMSLRHAALALAAIALFSGPAVADAFVNPDTNSGGGSQAGDDYLQCVPYARQLTGIRIYGDAHTWWGQAEGRYARGRTPRVGAVMAIHPHGNSRLGHVAAVSRIIDSRTILISHANWSPINGRRGQIENNVRAVDVSPGNDWSEVRVWYAPIEGLGTTHWPLDGFIYNQKPGLEPRTVQLASARSAPSLARAPSPVRAPAAAQGRDFSDDPIGRIIAERIR